MPFRSEKARLNRPPLGWWKKTYRRVSRQYPSYSAARKRKITGGIWAKYSPATKKRLLRKEHRWPASTRARSPHRKIVRKRKRGR